MPIYEYECAACEHRLEAIQKMSEAPLTDCPSCGEPGLRKLISAVAFRLKGSGWYETDFKTGDKKNVSTGDDKPPAEPSGNGKKTAGDKSADEKKSSNDGSTATTKKSSDSSKTSSSGASAGVE